MLLQGRLYVADIYLQCDDGYDWHQKSRAAVKSGQEQAGLLPQDCRHFGLSALLSCDLVDSDSDGSASDDQERSLLNY